jgi:two-component SAPR family response regulator
MHTSHPLVALSEFKFLYYDLVILDIKMEEMNGFEIYAKMLKVDEHVRVCFITGEMYYDEFRNERQEGQEEELEEVKQQYCKLDPDRFLQKPISNVDLVKSIEKIMRLNKGMNIQNK